MNVNTVTLIGRVTQAPVSKEFKEGKAFTRFSVATNHYRKNKEVSVEYHTIVTFGRLAEICKDFISKGRLVYVRGRLHTSRFEDDKKVLHTKTDVIADEMLLLDKKQASVRAESRDDADATEAVIELTPEFVATEKVRA